MSILSGGVPTGYRHTGERALTAVDIRWWHSAANDGRPISRMSCYASALRFIKRRHLVTRIDRKIGLSVIDDMREIDGRIFCISDDFEK